MLYDLNFDHYTLFNDAYTTPANVLIFLLSHLANFSFCILVVSFFLIIKKINKIEFYSWIALFFMGAVIALVIGENYFPDIGGYLRCVRDIRDNLVFDELGCQLVASSAGDFGSILSAKKGLPSLMFALVPIPSIATIAALGFINKIFTFLTYVFLRRRYFQNNYKSLLLIMVIPSILIFSSLGLRDNIIFLNQLLLMFAILTNRFIFSTILLLFLLAIKFQNAFIFMILYIGVFIFRANSRSRNLYLFLFLLTVIGTTFSNEVIGLLNFYKLAFLRESGEFVSGSILINQREFSSLGDLVIQAPKLLFLGWIKPLPTSAVYALFFLESVFIFFVVLYQSLNLNGLWKNPSFILMFITMNMGILLNALVVDNELTLLRYRYTFSLCIVTYLFYLQGYLKPLKSNEKL